MPSRVRVVLIFLLYGRMYAIGNVIRQDQFDWSKLPPSTNVVEDTVGFGAGAGSTVPVYRIVAAPTAANNNVIMTIMSNIKSLDVYGDYKTYYFDIRDINDPRLSLLTPTIPSIYPGNIIGKSRAYILLQSSSNKYVAFCSITVGLNWVEIYDLTKTDKVYIPKGLAMDWLVHVIQSELKIKHPTKNIWLGTIEKRLVDKYLEILTPIGFKILQFSDKFIFADTISPLGTPAPGKPFISFQYTPPTEDEHMDLSNSVSSTEIDTTIPKLLTCTIPAKIISQMKYYVDTHLSESFFYFFINNKYDTPINVRWDGTSYTALEYVGEFTEQRSVPYAYFNGTKYVAEFQTVSYSKDNDNDFYCITCHTHNKAIYPLYGSLVGPPSPQDIEIVIKNKRPMHIVFAVEGMYIIKLLPTGYKASVPTDQIKLYEEEFNIFRLKTYNHFWTIVFCKKCNIIFNQILEFSFFKYDGDITFDFFTTNIHRSLVYKGNTKITVAPIDINYILKVPMPLTEGIIMNYDINSAGKKLNTWFYLMTEKEYDSLGIEHKRNYINQFISSLFELYPNAGSTYTLMRISTGKKIDYERGANMKYTIKKGGTGGRRRTTRKSRK
jgi:hypothetical protein